MRESGMRAVLGIDAAWSPGNPSGVALAAEVGPTWKCLAVAPSYGLFCDLAAGKIAPGEQWSRRPEGGEAEIPALLRASRALLGGRDADVVAVDMPLAPEPILSRRAAENAAARALGRYKCGVHSPRPGCPGPLGAALTRACLREGYRLAVGDGNRPLPALLEVYPHALLIGLGLEHGDMRPGSARRYTYKVSRAAAYWPSTPLPERRARLARVLETVHSLLAREMALPADFPIPPESGPLARLKPYEDGLDALACCATGIRYLQNRALALGDAGSAIWIPENLLGE